MSSASKAAARPEPVKLAVVDEKAPPLAVIFGLSGEVLTEDEKKFFAAVNPLGFILFARNCKDPAQLAALTESLRACVGRDAPVLIDQEGGRVQRLKPPHWTAFPAACEFGDLSVTDFQAGCAALEKNTAAIAADLRAAGITVDCAPVLDLRFPQTDESIGTRAFSSEPDIVGTLGAAACRRLLEGGVIPVVKHMPGLGRADLDTHKALPTVDALLNDMDITDFRPYRDILSKTFSEAVWGMVGHAVYKDIDAQTPASCSRRVIDDVIRGRLGFNGLLLSDDLSMGALETYGSAAVRAEKVLRAGCDIALHCNGDFADMQDVAKRIPKMTPDAVTRYNRSVAWLLRNAR